MRQSDRHESKKQPVSAVDEQQPTEIIELRHWKVGCKSCLHSFLQMQNITARLKIHTVPTWQWLSFIYTS